MSLRRFQKVGSADTAVFSSSYILPREYVDQFANVVQVRGKKNSQLLLDGKENGFKAVEEHVEDANIEIQDSGDGDIDREGGSHPAVEDPLAATFANLVSECAERWKANADDSKKIMWDCFDECGIFLVVCRHGIILVGCDIVRSGEL